MGYQAPATPRGRIIDALEKIIEAFDAFSTEGSAKEDIHAFYDVIFSIDDRSPRLANALRKHELLNHLKDRSEFMIDTLDPDERGGRITLRQKAAGISA